MPVDLTYNDPLVVPDTRAAVAAKVHDPGRLAAVRASGLLDSPEEEAFDRLTRLAAKLTGTPVTFISLVDEGRDFYKSCFGFPEPLATERELAGTTFCHYAIGSTTPLVIDDTLASELYRDVPTVQSMGIRAYLGIPLVTSSGVVIGSFCAADFKPRHWSDLDIEVMTELAASTLRETELRLAVELANTERSRLKVLLEQFPVAVVFAEAPSGKVLLGNRKVEEILGSGGRLTDVDASELWTGSHADGSPMEKDEWPLARAMLGEVVRGEELIVERPDGKRVWIRVHGAPVRDGAGAIVGGVIAFLDINEERMMRLENERLYDEARRANRAKDDFLATVSHELLTPMTSILGWVRLLKMEKLANVTAVEAADAIEGSARLQAQLVDDLLDISRITSGKLALQCVMLDVNDVVGEAVQSAMPAATASGVSLRTELGEVPLIAADPKRLRQVVGNLLSNSIKFTPAGGLIELSTRASDDLVEITVHDTGRGIDSELLPYVFEKHRQASAGEKGGLGLGLAIVRRLVELHGGQVTARSEGPGRGSSFTVRLRPSNQP